MSGKAAPRLPSLGPGTRGRVTGQPIKAGKSIDGKGARPQPPAAKRPGSGMRPRAAPTPEAFAEPKNKEAPLVAASPMKDPGAYEGSEGSGPKCDGTRRISPTPPPPAQVKAPTPARRSNSGPPKMGGGRPTQSGQRKPSGGKGGRPKPGAKQGSQKRKAIEEAKARAEEERLAAQREQEEEEERIRQQELAEEFHRKEHAILDAEAAKRDKMHSREDRLWKDICLEAKGSVESIKSLQRRLEEVALSEAIKAIHNRIAGEMEVTEACEMKERRIVQEEELVAFSALLEAGVKSATLAVENCKERVMLEKDELEELMKDEQNWRRGDQKNEVVMREAIWQQYTSETHALVQWITVISVGIDKIVTNEHRYRLLLQKEQKDAWPNAIKHAAAERKVAKEKEAARLTVLKAEATARKVRDGIFHLMSDEELGRAAIFDEQLTAWMGVAQGCIVDKERADEATAEREEQERSEVLRLMVAEGRVRMDIKGEEEQEGYNILYKEQRQRHRLLEQEQVLAALVRMCNLEAMARTDLEALWAKRFASIIATAQGAEYAILRRTNKEHLKIRMDARCKKAHDEILSLESESRSGTAAEEAAEWQGLLQLEQLRSLQVSESLFRADVESQEYQHLMQVRAEELEGRVDINDRDHFATAFAQVLAEEAQDRRSWEEEEEVSASQLSVEQCRIVVEENRRQVKRRREVISELDTSGTSAAAESSSVLDDGPSVSELRAMRQELNEKEIRLD
mmetsp:Transcript_138714/g.241205  ORF Transcript_138714/g.241205 Transcript_138714/m.241205 type:complete len:741 (-) Transcript_138714:1594-3816(-)